MYPVHTRMQKTSTHSRPPGSQTNGLARAEVRALALWLGLGTNTAQVLNSCGVLGLTLLGLSFHLCRIMVHIYRRGL